MGSRVQEIAPESIQFRAVHDSSIEIGRELSNRVRDLRVTFMKARHRIGASLLNCSIHDRDSDLMQIGSQLYRVGGLSPHGITV